MARPRTMPSAQRRSEILAAAQRLFLQHGVQATAIEQIAAAAGVAKGTVYLSFASKDELILALGDRFAALLLARITSAVAAAAQRSWNERVAIWLGACVDGYLDEMPLHDLAFYGWRPASREGLIDNSTTDHLRGLLREGEACAGWSEAELRTAALFIFSGLHAAVDLAVAGTAPVDRGQLIRQIERLAFGALGQARPATPVQRRRSR